MWTALVQIHILGGFWRSIIGVGKVDKVLGAGIWAVVVDFSEGKWGL